MTPPVRPLIDPAALWETLVDHGLSEEQATRHVKLVLAQPQTQEQATRQYLKDVDPGKLASFGLGAADMMSFGLGAQIAKPLEESRLAEAASKQEHPTARLLGEVAGALTPIGADLALERAGVMAPSALRALAGGIRNTAGRAAAKTVLNAIEGGLYAGAQAGGHAESGHRLEAAKVAAPLGAAVGVALPWIAGAAGATAKKFLGPVVERVAGKAPPIVPTPAANPLAEVIAENQAMNDRAAQWIAERQANLGLTLSPKPLPDPLDVPTFLRTAEPLAPTAAERATNLSAKTLSVARRQAARSAFNAAVQAGQTLEEAKIAARWAAQRVGLLAQ